MKHISKSNISQVVKMEYAEAREWCRQGFSRYYRMMIDTTDGRIWSDQFISENDWKVYHADGIHQLEYVPGYVSETEAGYINDAVRLLKADGWDIKE